ncbi:MAG: hypothetical protein GF350_08435 [Chitinivibrionales bacterium]|nr:hypothetical protein [Chitinivibrionales bacterium]
MKEEALTEAGEYLQEISQAQKRMRDWFDRGDSVVSLYKGEGDAKNRGSNQYKILWQLTETQRPVLYLYPPTPDISRRFLEENPVAREAAEILEKAVKHSMECPGHEFHTAAKALVDDCLLPGRGVARIVYDADFEDSYAGVDAAGEEVMESKKTSEKVYIKYVYWKDFMHSDGRVWDDVWWVAFGSSLTKEEIEDEFGAELAKKIPLIKDMSEGDAAKYEHYEERDDVARVWEFWNKRTGKVYIIAEGYDEFLKPSEDDPLKLHGFFPTPEPLYMIRATGSLEPIPEYKMYEDHANQLYKLTARITDLIDWCKANGFYDAKFADEIGHVISSPEGSLKPVTGWSNFTEKSPIEWFPIDKFAQTIQLLRQEEMIVKSEIYEIVGVSDIMRGIAKPRVTKAGQEYEAQFSTGQSSRVGQKRYSVEVYFRDLIRIMAEVIADLFDPETMIQITGVRPAADVKEGLSVVIQMLRDERTRQFRIDVETESTVAPDRARQKEEINEFMSSFAATLPMLMNAVQSGMMTPDVAHEFIMAFARRSELGREFEDTIDKIGKQQQQQRPDPEQQAQAQKMQIEMQKLELEKQKLQADVMLNAKELALKQAELVQKGQIEQAKIMQKMREALLDLEITRVNVGGRNAQ